MATKLFFSRQTDSGYSTGSKDANLRGTAVNWLNLALTTTQGTSAITRTVTSVAGPIAGIEPELSSNVPVVWYSAPLDADVTIAGSITWNLRAAEAAMTNNAAINGQLEVIDGATGTITLIDKTARTVECGTAESANNFAETPASGVACKRGDRLRVRVFFDDSVDGNMAAGGILSFYHGGAAGATGDSYFTLTEDLTFVSEPAGSTIYPTDTASAVSTASVDREAWTSRGAGVQTDVANTTTGPTAPIQMTDTAGGTVVDWFTRQLAAFTLGGAVRVNARGLTSNVASDATWRCEIARVASDGTSPSVWGATTHSIQTAASETAHSFLVSGDDLAVSDGQRLRVRFYIDDFIGSGGGQMVTGHTLTLYYAGTSGGASGDTYLTFTQTLTEFVAGTTVTPTTAALATAAFAPTVTTPQLVTPATASLTATAFAPTVTLAETVTPTTLALTTSTFAPTATATDNQVLTPAIVALALTTFAPTITAPDPQLVMPTTASLTLTTFAVTVTATDHKLVTPTAAALTVALFAPTATLSDHKFATPTTITLTLTANAPTVTATDHKTATPTTASLATTAFAPTVSAPRLATPTTASFTTAAFAPTVAVTAHQAAMPTTASLVTASFAATVSATAHQTVTPTTTSLATAFEAPSVTTGDAREVVPTTATLTLVTFAPTVSGAQSVTVTPTAAARSLTTFAPTVTATAHQLVTPTTASLATTLTSPIVTAGGSLAVTPTTKALTLTTFAPTAAATAHIVATPTTKALTLTTFAPSAVVGVRVVPITASLVTSGLAPTVAITDYVVVVPDTLPLVLTGYPPDAIGVAPIIAVPTPAALVLTPQFALVAINPPFDQVDGDLVVGVPIGGAIATATGGRTRLVITTPEIRGNIESN